MRTLKCSLKFEPISAHHVVQYVELPLSPAILLSYSSTCLNGVQYNPNNIKNKLADAIHSKTFCSPECRKEYALVTLECESCKKLFTSSYYRQLSD